MEGLVFLLIALVAEIAGTMAGFGSSTIAMPLALLIFDFPTSLILVASLHIFGNISRLFFFFKSVDYSLLLRFAVPSVIFTIFGALLVGLLSTNVLKFCLGVFIVLFAVFSFVNPKWKLKSTLASQFVGGALSGFFAGIIGTGGAIRSAVLTAFQLPKGTYIATAAACALLVDFTRLPVYLSEFSFPSGLIYLIPLLFIVAVTGSFIGKKLVDYVSQEVFRKIVICALLLIGIKLLFDAIVMFSQI